MANAPIPINMPPPAMPLTDGNNKITTGWYQYLLQMFTRTGAQLGQIQATLVKYSSGGVSTLTSPVGQLDSIPSGEILGNDSAVAASPAPVGISAMLDRVFGSVVGALLTRDTSGWNELAPGADGQVLTSRGDSQTPDWEDAGFGAIASGDILANITGATAAPIGNTLSDILDFVLSNTRGAIIFRGASGWTFLSPGTAGYSLQTGGAGADPSWASVTVPSGANPTATASDIAVNGAAPTFMRSDAAPAVQKCSASVFGLVKVDNTTIQATGGVITAFGFAPSASPFHPGYQTNRFYWPQFPGQNGGGLTASVAYPTGKIFAVPAFIGASHTFSGLAVNTQAAGTWHFELGIYNNSNGIPGTLVKDFGSVSNGGSSGVKQVLQTFTLTPGWYWLTYSTDDLSGSANGIASAANAATYPWGSDAFNDVSFNCSIFATWVYSAGALPNPFPAVTYDTSIGRALPLIVLIG